MEIKPHSQKTNSASSVGGLGTAIFTLIIGVCAQIYGCQAFEETRGIVGYHSDTPPSLIFLTSSLLVLIGSVLALFISLRSGGKIDRDPIDPANPKPPAPSPSRKYAVLAIVLSGLGFTLAGGLFLQSCGLQLVSR